MSGLQSRVRRLEKRFAPDPDDPLGLRALTDDELALFIRLLEADRREVDAIVAATDPRLIVSGVCAAPFGLAVEG
jgi:hypothetical protein